MESSVRASAINKNMKIYENRVSACVPKETAHHHATSGTVHVDSCIRCIWRSYQPARAVNVHLCPWSFSSFWSSNMGGKCQRHPGVQCCVRQAQAKIFDMIIEVEKTNWWCNLNIHQIQAQRDCFSWLDCTCLILFVGLQWFAVNLEILTLGLTHAYVVWGGSWMQFVWCPKASKEEQIMTPIASAPNLSCCSNLYKLHHTSWNPQESTWNLTPKH